MTEYDLLFWTCILLVAALAYAIESGVANKNRQVIFSTMLSVTVTALYVLFLVDDTSSFDFAKPAPQPTEQATADAADVDMGVQKGGAAKGKAAAKSDKAGAAPQGIFSDCDICPSMIVVQAGNYTLGSEPTEQGRADVETARPMKIGKEFAIGRFEIMRSEFEVFLMAEGYKPSTSCQVGGRRSTAHTWLNPGYEQGEKHPAVCVSWTDAKAYTAWLSKKTGKKYRLPSEAEWEWAARAGSQHPFSVGQIIAPSHGNFNRAREGTLPSGFFGANKFGLFDVHGNAWEFVEDCWTADTSFLPADGRPLGFLGNCDYRTMRGGGWDSPPAQVRSAMRAYAGLSAASNTTGFRVMRSVDGE